MNVPNEEWKVRRQLEVVHLDLSLSQEGKITLVARGGSPSKRAALWTWSQSYEGRASAVEVAGEVDHLVRCAILDRPTSPSSLQRALLTPYRDEKLPW
uniref:Uncharacterized protein n=1 Tax=uncultured prokaryote TaxID=198431 RepID=A0A0H5QLS2_9ZZZZ|nr:hypothetical protein [uncultured prokaryote]